MAPDMKTVRFPRGARVLHIEAPGCIVNVRPGLTDADGRPVCAIEILPDGGWSVADGAHSNVRVIQDAAPGPRFASWAEVLAYALAREPLYYRAPLDARATRLVPALPGFPRTERTYKRQARTIRIWPPGSVGRGARRTSDPFTADARRLDRFSKEA